MWVLPVHDPFLAPSLVTDGSTLGAVALRPGGADKSRAPLSRPRARELGWPHAAMHAGIVPGERETVYVCVRACMCARPQPIL